MYCAVGLVGKGCEMGTAGVEIEEDSRKCVVQWVWGGKGVKWELRGWRLRETAGNVLCSGFGWERV